MPRVGEQSTLESKKRRKLSTWLCWILNHLENFVSKTGFFSIRECTQDTQLEGRVVVT